MLLGTYLPTFYLPTTYYLLPTTYLVPTYTYFTYLTTLPYPTLPYPTYPTYLSIKHTIQTGHVCNKMKNVCTNLVVFY